MSRMLIGRIFIFMIFYLYKNVKYVLRDILLHYNVHKKTAFLSKSNVNKFCCTSKLFKLHSCLDQQFNSAFQ